MLFKFLNVELDRSECFDTDEYSRSKKWRTQRISFLSSDVLYKYICSSDTEQPKKSVTEVFKTNTHLKKDVTSITS